jgi:beta-mannosidase
MEDMDFWYRAIVERPTVSPGERLVLVFEGLDVFATVYLNGEVVGSHRNMFTPLRVDVHDLLKEGSNVLEICLASPVLPPGRDLATPGVVGFGNRVRLHVRKAQSCFGWNVMPRLVTVGIWRPVSWNFEPADQIESVYLRTIEVQPDGAAIIEVSVDTVHRHSSIRSLECDIEVAGMRCTLRFPGDGQGARATTRVVVPQAQLWWPHDHGEQHLYKWSAILRRDGTVVDDRAGRFGIRTIGLVQELDPDGGTSFRLEINGTPIFLKGMNWSPVDAIYSRIDDQRYEDLVRAAKDANVNALRVWGGGIYEGDRFYELCDELGIAVLHDFMFACGAYPQDEPFLEECRIEAVHVLTRLRNHPSIVLWFGDNENDEVAEKDLAQPEYRLHSALSKRVLRDAVRALSPHTPYVPTSPHSPTLAAQGDPSEGDVHLWAHGSAYDDEYFTTKRPRMVTEIGFLSMPSRAVIESWLPPETPRWPVFVPDFLVRGDNMRLDQDGLYRRMFANIADLGWEAPADLDALVEMSQRSQADASRFWIDFYGSQPQCWGLFLWNLADCWPQMSCAYIAYPFEPKPGLAAVRDAFGALEREL